MAGKIQKQDIKTEAELIAGGGTAADLANDTQVYVTALGINKTLDDAITDGDISGTGGIMADGSIAFTADQSMGGFNLTDVANPIDPQDAATKDYVDSATGGGVLADGSVPFTGDQSLGNNDLTDVGAITINAIAGEAFNANTLYIVSYAGTTKVLKADVQDVFGRLVLGWIYSPIAVATDDPVDVYISGTITLVSNVFSGSEGLRLFLHNSTPGAYSLTVPTVAPIGVAGVVIAANKIQVLIQNAVMAKSVSEVEIRLTNGGYLQGYNTGGSAIGIVKINGSNEIEFNSLPIFGGSSLVTEATVTSGTYNPTRSAETNLDTNVTMSEAQYMRVKNTVTVSGRFTADPTTTLNATSFEFTLPVASNIGAVEDVAGVAFCGAIAAQGASISGSIANDTAVVSWIAADTTSQSWSYTFTYQVI